jgi:DNA-directed RNA polymerase specialized sigma24 family protein
MEAELTESDLPPAAALSSTSGDEGFVQAFDELYDCAYQHAYKLLGDRQEDEDLAQEACTRACMRWRHLDNPPGTVKSHAARGLHALRATLELADDVETP